jgi:Tfp pilus assembly protein PilF
MKGWLDESLQPTADTADRMQNLLELLLGRNELELEYHQGYTGTAIETFQTRRANCLAFTHLFVGMSRWLDLPVYYLKVDDVQSFEREGDLVVVSGHITAGFGPAAKPRILEFSLFPASSYRRVRPLSDLSAVALFYSNRGAERLLEGDRQEALEWLETAVRIDPDLPDAWVNLGVVRRRAGELAGAETAYRRAIEIDPEFASAYQNLSALLFQLGGREDEAQRLLALTDHEQNRNPFNFLSLGDLSLSESRFEDAGRYFRRALDLDSEGAEPQAAMGQWFLAAGERRKARKWLKRAERVGPAVPRVLALQEALEQEEAQD